MSEHRTQLRSNNPGISVVIPTYRGQDALTELVRRLEAVLEQCASDYEIILVKDGSPDSSWEIISKMLKTHSRLKGINLARNYGQHNALLSGIRQARFPITITMESCGWLCSNRSGCKFSSQSFRGLNVHSGRNEK